MKVFCASGQPCASKGFKFGPFHSCKLIWKQSGALNKTTILYIEPFMSFNHLREGRFVTLAMGSKIFVFGAICKFFWGGQSPSLQTWGFKPTVAESLLSLKPKTSVICDFLGWCPQSASGPHGETIQAARSCTQSRKELHICSRNLGLHSLPTI